jgi:hypothetical protein
LTLIGSIGFQLSGFADLPHLTVVTLVATILICITGVFWLLYGLRFERPQDRLALVAVLVLSIAALVLLAWGQAGPLKTNFLKNPALVQPVLAWGILPLIPTVVAWRLLAGSVQTSVPIDSAPSWLALGFLAFCLGSATAQTIGSMSSFSMIFLVPIVPWIVVWLLGLWLRWSPLPNWARLLLLTGSLAWGVLGLYMMFALLLWLDFDRPCIIFCSSVAVVPRARF